MDSIKSIGNLMTTAMGVMPHTNVDRALEIAMSLDVPYWPQLPKYSYYEDMYVQVSEHFPGIVLDLEKETLRFSYEKFSLEIEETLANFDNIEYFDVSEQYSAVYRKFLSLNLEKYPAIRGQLEGPVSFGFYVKDIDSDRPIIFDDEIRDFMLEFMAKRINAQLRKLKEKNSNAFMFIDEPGLQFVFSAMSGYNDIVAKRDIENFLSMVDSPRGIHLCGNPDWDFLLGFNMEIVSIDLYTNRAIIPMHGKAVKSFIERGGKIVWGIIPTNFEPFMNENMESLIKIITETWDKVVKSGIDFEELLANSLLSPATCCLVNKDKEKTVEKAFGLLKDMSETLKEKYGLN